MVGRRRVGGGTVGRADRGTRRLRTFGTRVVFINNRPRAETPRSPTGRSVPGRIVSSSSSDMIPRPRREWAARAGDVAVEIGDGIGIAVASGDHRRGRGEGRPPSIPPD